VSDVDDGEEERREQLVRLIGDAIMFLSLILVSRGAIIECTPFALLELPFAIFGSSRSANGV
jgi:hypothetical protein